MSSWLPFVVVVVVVVVVWIVVVVVAKITEAVVVVVVRVPVVLVAVVAVVVIWHNIYVSGCEVRGQSLSADSMLPRGCGMYAPRVSQCL